MTKTPATIKNKKRPSLRATTQKLEWAKKAIQEMRKAQAADNVADFQYHFGAFLAFIGALRQFLLVEPHTETIANMDVGDLYYCNCIDLRNIDVHTANALEQPRKCSNIEIVEATRSLSDVVGIVSRADGSNSDIEGSDECQSPQPSDAATITITTEYFVVDLPPDFATKNSGKPRKTTQLQVDLIETTPVLTLATKGLQYFETVVLRKACDIRLFEETTSE